MADWDRFSGNALELRQGNTFVAVDLVVVNSGDLLTHVSQSLRISLTDLTGVSYVPDQIASLAVGMGMVGGVAIRGNAFVAMLFSKCQPARLAYD